MPVKTLKMKHGKECPYCLHYKTTFSLCTECKTAICTDCAIALYKRYNVCPDCFPVIYNQIEKDIFSSGQTKDKRSALQ